MRLKYIHQSSSSLFVPIKLATLETTLETTLITTAMMIIKRPQPKIKNEPAILIPLYINMN